MSNLNMKTKVLILSYVDRGLSDMRIAAALGLKEPEVFAVTKPYREQKAAARDH